MKDRSNKRSAGGTDQRGGERIYLGGILRVLSRDFIACVCMCVAIHVPVITSISFSTIHFIPKTP